MCHPRRFLLLLLLSAFFATDLQAKKKKQATTPLVEIETNMGTIRLMLYDNTPKHRDNFLKLVGEHFYDSTLFHRVIPEFMIQGGDPNSKTASPGQPLGSGDLGYRIDAEINDSLIHQYGAVAAARDGNPQKASSASQFYIVVGKKPVTAETLDALSQRSGRKYTPAQKLTYEQLGGTPHLDGQYTVFGQVLEGMEVVEKIIQQPRDAMDRPKEDMIMYKVRIIKPKKKKRFLFF